MLYRLHTLDILDGEINDEYTTSDILTLPDDPTADDVAKALIGLERMAEDWPRDDVKLDDSEGPETLYVTHKDGTKVYKLVQEEDEDDDTPPDCPKCGQPMTDTYCHTGKARCDECDPECPGCSDGPGPMAAYRDTEQDDEAEDDDAPH